IVWLIRLAGDAVVVVVHAVDQEIICVGARSIDRESDSISKIASRRRQILDARKRHGELSRIEAAIGKVFDLLLANARGKLPRLGINYLGSAGLHGNRGLDRAKLHLAIDRGRYRTADDRPTHA